MWQPDRLLLGTQYYRPPFPEARYWREDFERMVASGLNTVQFWACWGWVEGEPGVYNFDDYDELVAGAKSAGLSVVISTIAEIHPFWIHRLVPGSEMVDHMGQAVVPSLRKECNVGLTPGGCFDNPAVKERMRNFLSAIAGHYASSTTLVAWDCWNETRWSVNSDGYVCHCPSTLSAFRSWLGDRYGDLAGLGAAWKRRYASWDDVVPGKRPNLPYTDIVEYEAFLTWRAAQHAAFRAGTIRGADPNHPIVAHCGNPSIYSGSYQHEQAIARGNDFDLAEVLDGYGSSHFPVWAGFGATEYGSRVEAVRSAAGDKPAWVSELQGGAASDGFGVLPPVSASAQQRWVWGAYGRGVKTVLFWCWRDEVFGPETSGFGLSGLDGKATERLEKMARTGALIRDNEHLLLGYQPDRPEIGALFSQSAYQLFWADKGNAPNDAAESLRGWLNALERAQLPYSIVDSSRPGGLAGLKLLIVPWPLSLPAEMGPHLLDWVRAGGALVAESELDAFDERGFYRYPPDRPLARGLGVLSLGRRPLEGSLDLGLGTGDAALRLQQAGWLEALGPEGAEVLARSVAGEVTATRRPVGHGQVVALGSFPGLAHSRQGEDQLDRFVATMARVAGVEPVVEVEPADGETLQWRSGRSGGSRLLFLSCENGPGPVVVKVRRSALAADGPVTSLIGQSRRSATTDGGWSRLEVELSDDGLAVLYWGAGSPGPGVVGL